ncbi:MAG TPA: FtsW/RodA/SpoVE family cell cycle protein [Tissierellia bacterium]|jgi:cell division protein FtsW|nr:FtsW/RodA/SpoVE family cell cycle protein [Tissierellia bacterium]
MRKIHFGILIPVMLLLIIGWLLVFSSSAYFSMARRGDAYYFIRRHSYFILAGLVTMIGAFFVNYRVYSKPGVLLPFVFTTFILMILTLIAGETVNNATRWIVIAGVQFMPSDLAKIAIIMTMSTTLSSLEARRKRYIAILLHMIVPMAMIILTYLQPDFSTTVTLFIISAAMLFVGFDGWGYFMVIVGGAAGAFYLIAALAPYRMVRITTFFAGLTDINEVARQIRYGILAIASGGVFGVGPGESTFNKLYIPEPHNDMIVSTLGEEFGFVGIAVVLLLFFILVFNIFRMALNASTLQVRVMSTGIGSLIFAQMVINFGSTLGLVPPTGIGLPFISYGGTSMLVMLGAVGILLNIYASEARIR